MAGWASAGALIALAWGYYYASANQALAIAPIVAAAAQLTQPFVSAVLALDPAARMSLYSCALANAAGYALIGFFVETKRRY